MKIITKSKRDLISTVLLFLLTAPGGLAYTYELFAQEIKSKYILEDEKRDVELFFTYAGVTLGGGIDRITYKDWLSDSEGQGTKDVTGFYYCGGALFNIFVKSLIGEFSIQYIYNSNSDVPVGHMLYDANGKYLYQLYDFLALTGGAGIYIETRPATRSYDSGAGFNALLGVVYNVARDMKLVFDIVGRYGSFGVGEESTRQSYGAKIGIVYKVGRI